MLHIYIIIQAWIYLWIKHVHHGLRSVQKHGVINTTDDIFVVANRGEEQVYEGSDVLSNCLCDVGCLGTSHGWLSKGRVLRDEHA